MMLLATYRAIYWMSDKPTTLPCIASEFAYHGKNDPHESQRLVRFFKNCGVHGRFVATASKSQIWPAGLTIKAMVDSN